MDAREFARLNLEANLVLSSHPQHPPSQQLIKKIADRSCGNPLYIRHLIRHLIDKLSSNNNLIQLAQGVQIDQILPTTIEQLIQSRLKLMLSRAKEDNGLLNFLLVRLALLGATTSWRNVLVRSSGVCDPSAGNGHDVHHASGRVGRARPR